MRYDQELAKLAALLRVGARTARAIAMARGRDGETILGLADEAEAMALDLDTIIDGDTIVDHGDVLRLRRDR